MRKLGKENFQVHHVTTLSGVTLDEVKARIADFVAQANQANRAQVQEATAEHQPEQEAQKDATIEHQPLAEVRTNQPEQAQRQDAITDATLGHQPQQEAQPEAPAEHQPQRGTRGATARATTRLGQTKPRGNNRGTRATTTYASRVGL